MHIANTCITALLCVCMLGVAGAPRAANDIVSPDVYAEMASSSDGKARVFVIMQPMPLLKVADLDEHMATVEALQTDVLSGLTFEEFDPIHRYKTIPAMFGLVSELGLSKLATHPYVIVIGPDATAEATLDSSVPFIGANVVHNMGLTGEGVTVAVLDSGIDQDHPDLIDDIAAGGFDWVNNDNDPEDDFGHGTHVSGIITSKGTIAPLGVAPDADILPLKVLNSSGSGNFANVTAAVDYCVQNVNNYANLCAINLSLGGGAYPNCPCDSASAFTIALGAAIDAAKNVGITTFAASGNSGNCGAMLTPACLQNAIAVARSTHKDVQVDVVFASDQSPCNEISAPGFNILSTTFFGGAGLKSGTSMATPHAAAVAALMCQCAVDGDFALTPVEIRNFLKDTGVATTDACAVEPQPIRVDALAAVTYLKAVPVFIATFDARANGSDIEITWQVRSDEAVDGIKIYRRTADTDREITIFSAPHRPNVERYVDGDVHAGDTYHYTLAVVNLNGDETRSPVASATVVSQTMRLGQNYPNPFNPVTTIVYSVAEQMRVTLAIYDAQGKRVTELVNQVQDAGRYQVEWDGRDDAGNHVGTAVYFYRLETGTTSHTRKMLLLK